MLKLRFKMNELNEKHLSNIEFIKNYDPQKGVGVSAGKLIAAEKNERVSGISEGVLQCINDSLNYNMDLCNKKIMNLSQEEESSPVNTEDRKGQVENTSDKIKDLLLLIDDSRKIKNGLSNLISNSEKMGHSHEEVEQLKAIANSHIEQFSQLLNKDPLTLKISGNRTDAPLNVALKTLIKPDYKEEFKNAIDQGDTKAIQDLLSKGANINMKLDGGKTPLTLSMSLKNNELANFLIASGAKVNQADDNGDFTFLIAIQTMNFPMVQSLLMNPSVDVNVQNRAGHTALIMGSHAGSEPLVQGLLSRNAEVNKPNNENQTPVLAAAANGHDKIVSLLISKKADLTLPDNTGATPLIVAAFRGHVECVRLILKEGIKPDEATALGGNTALHAAAHTGNSDIAAALMKAGADPLKVNANGASALSAAAAEGKFLCYEEMVKSVDLKSITQDLKEELMFSLASGGMRGELNDLIKIYPDVNFTSKNGDTLLMVAASKSQYTTVSLLLEKGANASGVFDSLGHDPLIKAAFGGSPNLILELLKHGADPMYRDLNGFTAMDYILLLRPLVSVSSLFPQSAIEDEFRHFNMNQASGTVKDFADLALKLKTARSANLHRRLEIPIDESTKISADKLYSLLHQSQFDVEQLRLDDIQAHSKLQAARMSGSTSITIGFESADKKTEATNDWKRADDMVRSWVKNREPLTSEKLCQLNSILNTKNRAAEYRFSAVTAGGSRLQSYVPENEITTEIDSFFIWLTDRLEACDSGKENPIIVAALANQRLVSIHPFNDGNGRTCRLVMDYILQRSGLPPSSPNDVNVAIFALFPSDMTPSKAVMGIVSGLENSYNIFKGLT